ncbi:MAG: hypothetical protein ABI763_08780 [Bacteroidota bacterium]
MKKFLLFVACLFVAFVMLNIFYLWILPKVDLDFKKTKEAAGFRGEKNKIIVLGNSTALDGINSEMLTAQFGGAHNLAVGGATLITNYIQLKSYLETNAKPDKVLLFLSSGNNDYDTTHEVNPIVSYYYQHVVYEKPLKDLPLFRFRWLFIENMKKLFSGAHRSAYLLKGQFRSDKIVVDQTILKQGTMCSEINYLHPGFEYLRRMAELCDSNEIRFIVFEIPCWNESQNNLADTEVKFPLLKPMHIYNLNRIAICDTLFDSKMDWLSKNHLNYKGSIKLTRAIINVLLKPDIGTAPIN